MRRVLARVGLLAALVAALLGLPTPIPAAPSPATPRVVMILAPYLDWPDVTPTSTPTLWSLAGSGAVGAVNTRSRGAEAGGRPSPLDGALSLSAGSWAIQNSIAPSAYSVNENYEVGTAAEAYRRTTGNMVGKNRIVFLGLPMTQRTNADRSPEVRLGTLGQAVENAGGITAAVGNSDTGYLTGERRWIRPAALTAMNSNGLVALGDVSAKMLRENPWAPFGIETDERRVDQTLGAVSKRTAETTGPALVVIDSGDINRAMKFRSQTTDAVYQGNRVRAMRTLDDVTAMAVRRFPDATIMVVSLSTGDAEQGDPIGVGPLIVKGPGYSGYLTSDSTQRDGLVTDLDVTAAAFQSLHLERPVWVVGSPLRSVPSNDSALQKMTRLAQMNTTAIVADSTKRGVVNGFVAFIVAVLALAALVIARAHAWHPKLRRVWVTVLKASLLLAAVIPVSSWLMFAVIRWPQSTGSALASLAVTVALLWGLSLLVWWKSRQRIPVVATAFVTVAVILADQWLGAPASFTNFFGYSPLLAARFYGIGNEAAAMVVGAAVVGAALLFDEWPDSRGVRIAKRYGLPLLGAAVIITCAAPFLGANIGVAIWGVVGFGLAWVLMNGHHVSWKLVFWLFLAVVLVIAAFAAIDLFGGGAQTHLGRAISSAEQGGSGELWSIIARKAATNVRVLTHTNWAYILVAVLGFLGFMRYRPQGDFAETLQVNPHFADAITVSLVAGLVAYFTEDSGIVIPALEVFYVGVSLAWLMLSQLDLSAPPTVRQALRSGKKAQR